MQRNGFRSSRWSRLTALAILSGGTLFASCQGMIWQAIKLGSQDYVLSLLDPSVVLAGLSDGGSGNGP